MRAALGAAASMALVANAVLVPPNIVADRLGDDLAMESLGINPFKRTVAVECPGCPSAKEENGSLVWDENAGNTFLLDFEVGPREDTLDIDGAQLYPPTFGHLSEPFYVTQLGGTSESGDPLRLRVTGYTFHFNSAKTVSEAGNELLPMTFHIRSIEGRFIEPPEIAINLLKDVSGRLMIASFETKEKSALEQKQECEQWPLLCKWRAIVAGKIDDVKEMGKEKIEQVKKLGKGCHRQGRPHLAGTPYPPHTGMEDGHPHHPHHSGHHHDHHKHHKHHGKARAAIRRVVFSILLPIIIGAFAGALIYLVGMALGCLIAVVVAKVRGQSYYTPVSLEEEDEEEGFIHDEKAVFVELPGYDEPPVYQEAVEKEVVDDGRKSDV